MVELRDKSGQTFRPFLDSGNGNTGFTVYNVQKTSSSGYAYVKVRAGFLLRRSTNYRLGFAWLPATIEKTSNECVCQDKEDDDGW